MFDWLCVCLYEFAHSLPPPIGFSPLFEKHWLRSTVLCTLVSSPLETQDIVPGNCAGVCECVCQAFPQRYFTSHPQNLYRFIHNNSHEKEHLYFIKKIALDLGFTVYIRWTEIYCQSACGMFYVTCINSKLPHKQM